VRLQSKVCRRADAESNSRHVRPTQRNQSSPPIEYIAENTQITLVRKIGRRRAFSYGAAKSIDNMQAQQLHIGDEQNPAVHIREEETGNFQGCFTISALALQRGIFEVRRIRSGFQFDLWTNP
jgi:hypothetical protein